MDYGKYLMNQKLTRYQENQAINLDDYFLDSAITIPRNLLCLQQKSEEIQPH